jgi:hypothetical protein
VQQLLAFKENPRERGGNVQTGPWRQGYFGLIKTTVRFERWNDILDGKTIPVYDKPEQNAWRHWAIGLAQAATGQMDKAKATLNEMQKDLEGVTSSKEPIGIGAQELEATMRARRRPEEGLRAVPWRRSRSGDALYGAAVEPRPVAEGWQRRAGARDSRRRNKAARDAGTRAGQCLQLRPAASLDGLVHCRRIERRGHAARLGRVRTRSRRRCRSWDVNGGAENAPPRNLSTTETLRTGGYEAKSFSVSSVVLFFQHGLDEIPAASAEFFLDRPAGAVTIDDGRLQRV